jgi:hypothetical protein
MEASYLGHFEHISITECQFLTGSMVEMKRNAKCQLFHITIRKMRYDFSHP